MGDRNQRVGALGIGADQVGGQITDLARQVEGILAKQTSDQFGGVDLPEIDSSTPVTFEIIDGQIFVNIAYFIPGYATSLRTIIVRDDLMVDSFAFNNKRIKSTATLSDADRAAFPASVQFRFEEPLKSNKTYRVITLIAFDINDAPHQNPEPPFPKFADYPGNALLTFTTGATAANPPGKPTLARIVENTPDFVKVRIYADETQVKTFAEQGTTHIQPFFHRVSDTSDKVKPIEAVEDASLTSQDVQVPVGDPEVSSGVLRTGLEYEQVFNRAYAGDEFADAPSTSTVTLFAGGYANPDDGADLDHAMVNLACVFTINSAEPNDGTRVSVTCTLTQPTPPYRERNARLFRRKSSQTAVDNVLIEQKSLADPEFNIPGDADVVFDNVPTKASKEYVFTLEVTGILQPDAPHHSFESDPFTASAATLSAAQTAAQGGPSYVNGGGMRASVKDYDDTFNPPGAAGDAKYLGNRWETFAASGVKIDNLGSGGGGSFDADGVDWVSTEARLLLDTAIVTRGGKPAVMLGKILAASQDWSGNVLLRAKVADVTADITMAFVNSGGDICTATKTGFVIPVAKYEPLFFVLLVPSTFTRNGKEWLELRLGADPSHQLVTAQWQLEPGIAYHFWKMNQTEAQVQPTTNPSDQGEGLVSQIPVTVVDDEGNEYTRGGTHAGGISLA